MKIMVIINSLSARKMGDNIGSALANKFYPHDITIISTKYSGHATKIARRAAKLGYDMVIAAGGDGTVNEVLNGIISSNIILGIIPIGTANDLANYLGIPNDINKACDIVLNQNLRAIDVIQVNDLYYLTAGGIGLPCDTLKVTKAIRRWGLTGRILTGLLSSKMYVIGLIIAYLRLHKKTEETRIQLNGKSYNINTVSLIVGNQPVLGGNFHILPGAVNNDGELDIFIILNDEKRIRLLSTLFKTLSGSHTRRQNVKMFQATSLTIKTSQPVSLFGDGEIWQ
jgi:YegS/Rv2252/BmrU family lipid kinase